jgi:formylglycine-generating enzyme required for sulfatase activity
LGGKIVSIDSRTGVRRLSTSFLALSLCLSLACLQSCGKDEGPGRETAPVASFTVSPSSGTLETEFLFDASGSSDAQDPASALDVRWDWENDGVWDTAFSKTKTATHRYNTGGTKTIKLEVKDTGGLTDTTTSTVTVEGPNTAPEAAFTVTPLSGDTETEFLFDASGSSDAQDPVSALEVRWDWDNNGVWDTEYSTTKTATRRYGMPGTKTIKLAVMDTEGLTDSTTATVTVAPAPPQQMVLIEAGSFTMGSDEGEGSSDEEPEHQPYISAYYMDIYEVTNEKYANAANWAVKNGLATWNGFEIVSTGSPERIFVNVPWVFCRIERSGATFRAEEGYENHPMIAVSWYGAAAYCNWCSVREGRTPCYDMSTWECDFDADGYRLPTEAEWEKGARGSLDERTYPWGEDPPNCNRSNNVGCYQETTPAGFCSEGLSPYGLYDMSGNVSEWCNDRYDSAYYSASPTSDPRGPLSGLLRVVRGGSWIHDPWRCAERSFGNPAVTNDYSVGFRRVLVP